MAEIFEITVVDSVSSDSPIEIGKPIRFNGNKKLIGEITSIITDEPLTTSLTLSIYYNPSPKSQLHKQSPFTKNKKPL